MSTRDLKHPWKSSVWIIWIGAIVLGSWLLQGIRICVKEPYCTSFCGKLCRIRQDHAEPGEKQDHRSDRKWWKGYSRVAPGRDLLYGSRGVPAPYRRTGDLGPHEPCTRTPRVQIVESVELTPDLEALEERRCSGRRALAGHGLHMEDLASMFERQCRKACNLRCAAEELEETGSNGRARRYQKRGSPKPAAEARAMERDPRLVKLWSAADSEGHSDGYRTAFPSESEEMAIPPTRAHTAPELSLEHDAEALERPIRARTAPVARHTEPTRDNMGDTPMAEESEAPGTVGCARSGGKHVECHCEHVSFLIGKYPKMGMDAIVQHLDRLDNQKDGLEEDIAGILDDQSEVERDMAELRAEQDRYREKLEMALQKQQRVVDSLLHLVEDMSGRLKRIGELQPVASGQELPARPATAELVERVRASGAPWINPWAVVQRHLTRLGMLTRVRCRLFPCSANP